MSEEFAFKKFFRNGCTIDLDERRLRPRAPRMNRASHQLLTDPGFSKDEHVGRRLRNGLHLGKHLLECGTFADDAAEVHRYIDFLPQVVALPFNLLSEPRILGEGCAQLSLRALALRNVFRRDQHAMYAARLVTIRNRRHDEVEHPPVPGHHLPFLVAELPATDNVLQFAFCETFAICLAVKFHDRAPHDLVARVTHFLQPVVGDGHDAPVGVDRVQHGRCGAIQLAIFPVGSGLIGPFRIDRDGTQEHPVRIVLDQ